MASNDRTNTPKDSHYARLRRQHRDPDKARPVDLPAEGLVRLYGLHTVRAALDNPDRRLKQLWVSQNALARLDIADIGTLRCPVEIMEPRALDRLVAADAVHQGAILDAEPLRPLALEKLGQARLLLVLDQVTDPHNVGAIIRSAVAFGADGLVTTARHSPAESGVLAKSASGALEHLAHIEVRNLAEALERLHEQGFRTIGLDSDGPAVLEDSLGGERIALVLGAEGKGLRAKTRETVATLARLDLPGVIRSLNVSNAAAVSLYAARRHLDALSKAVLPG